MGDQVCTGTQTDEWEQAAESPLRRRSVTFRSVLLPGEGHAARPHCKSARIWLGGSPSNMFTKIDSMTKRITTCMPMRALGMASNLPGISRSPESMCCPGLCLRKVYIPMFESPRLGRTFRSKDSSLRTSKSPLRI